jgi:hypothetical protein
MRTALAGFNSSVSRIRDIADELDNDLPNALADSFVLERHETTRCAATVILSGYWETFLKELAEEFISETCNLNRPFSSLPEKMRHTHYELGGAVLSRRAQDERAGRNSRILASSGDIATRLASVGAIPYDLVWEAFADTFSNPDDETVKDYLKRFGISRAWDEIGNRVPFATILRTQLKSFVALRHECAHTGSASTIPTTVEIREFCDMLATLAEGIVRVLENHLRTL